MQIACLSLATHFHSNAVDEYSFPRLYKAGVKKRSIDMALGSLTRFFLCHRPISVFFGLCSYAHLHDPVGLVKVG